MAARTFAGVLVALALLCSVASRAAAQPAPAPATLAQISWLAAGWVGTDGMLTFEERWTAPAGGVMLATGRTLRGDRLVVFEFLRIQERNGGLVYIAQPNGQPPTEFVLTRISANSITFENPAHDFPKMIQYTLKPDGATLEARVSDGGPQGETYVFLKDSLGRF